ncbi:hypothetical protein BDV95DRAFT_490971 [Massariosphaeria phaeospora]|uniref:Uncharacterized protein n=1 Tax=Massariosphaeria phaeospora TaxID=100035 RepID=A0A7C8MAF9_9PLEO|nr:hypothetical protein BDV95DRAFT_490971 [Massariosphaeria phaeospora]
MEERYGIPAEDPYGDDLRARIASGWRVLRRLSQISQEVYGLPAKTVLKSRTDIAWKVVHPSRFESEVVNQREDIIFKRRMEYIKNLPGKLAEDYKMMFMLLSSAFRSPISNYGEAYTPWVFDWSCGIDGQRLLRRGQSWVTWFVLHEGPDLFRDQWWNLPHDLEETKNHIRDRLINAWFGTTKISPEDYMRHFLPKEWNDVNEKLHTMQRDYASKIHKALDDKATPGFINASPIRCFSQYAECRQLRVETGVPPIRETLSHVPFHIDFRCPDELFQKHCTVTRERSLAAMASPFSARE